MGACRSITSTGLDRLIRVLGGPIKEVMVDAVSRPPAWQYATFFTTKKVNAARMNSPPSPALEPCLWMVASCHAVSCPGLSLEQTNGWTKHTAAYMIRRTPVGRQRAGSLTLSFVRLLCLRPPTYQLSHVKLAGKASNHLGQFRRNFAGDVKNKKDKRSS